jgi:hypothetical protein
VSAGIRDLGTPYTAEETDIPSILKLLEDRGVIPMREALQERFQERIQKREVFVIRYQEIVRSFLVIDREEKLLDMLVVGDDFKEWQHGERLIETGLAQFLPGDTVTVCVPEFLYDAHKTLREALRKYGFAESDKTVRNEIRLYY